MNFSSPNAGALFVTATGVYGSTTSDFGSGASDVRVLITVRDASGTLKASGVLSRLNGGVGLMADYPGGNSVWTVTATEIDYTIKGAGSVAVNGTVTVRLGKRW